MSRSDSVSLAASSASRDDRLLASKKGASPLVVAHIDLAKWRSLDTAGSSSNDFFSAIEDLMDQSLHLSLIHI